MNEENKIPKDDDMLGLFLTFGDVKNICQSHIDNDENGEPYTVEEFEEIIRWIIHSMIAATRVILVLKGDLDIAYSDNEDLEDRMLFKLTKQGVDRVESDPIFKQAMKGALPGFNFTKD